MKNGTHYRLTSSTGFTLIELLVGISIAAVLAGIAAPSVRSFYLNNRLTTTSNELLRSIQTARTEATKRQASVVLCTSSNPSATTPTCSKTGITGWIVFQDDNSNWDHESTETLIQWRTFESDKIYMLADNSMRFSFAPTGFVNPNGATPSTQTLTRSVVICDKRGNTSASGQSTGQSIARGLQISATGRSRATRDVTQISALLTAISSSCPP